MTALSPTPRKPSLGNGPRQCQCLTRLLLLLSVRCAVSKGERWQESARFCRAAIKSHKCPRRVIAKAILKDSEPGEVVCILQARSPRSVATRILARSNGTDTLWMPATILHAKLVDLDAGIAEARRQHVGKCPAWGPFSKQQPRASAS